MKKYILVLIAFLSLSACHTFHIKNGESYTPAYQSEEFHHIGVLRLVEFSSPVDPVKQCEGGKWVAVRTRTGPLQVLVRLFSGGFYDPEEVAISCK